MKCKKWLIVLVACVLSFSLILSACNPNNPSGKPNDNKPDNGADIGGEIPDDNDVEVVEPDKTEHEFDLVSKSEGKFTYKCSDCGKEETVTISCESGTSNAYAVEGNTVTFCNINEKSVYDISGVFYGNVVIDVTDEYKFELQMSGFEMYSRKQCPIAIMSGDKVTISAKKSTENYVYDMRGAVDSEDEVTISSSIYAKCDLDIQGKGSLYVKSLNNNGIHTNDDLSVKNLALQVDCIDNALEGNDSVTIESGSIVLIARQGDGIKTKNSDISGKGNQRGTVAITGGDVLIYAACDGIDASYNVTIDESSATVTLQIFTDKYSKYTEQVATVASAHYILGAPGGPGGPGGHGGFGGGMNDGNSDKGDYSTKGIKADNLVAISAGTVTISAYDDAIHANNDVTLENNSSALGNVTITGGNLTLRSNDDAIHADNKVLISGGDINIVGSYEGIEGYNVTIEGGNVSVVSSDDGINGTATIGTAITVSGGKLYVYAGGDGVDSNSRASYEGIHFSGGMSVIISTGQSDSSIDTEQGYKYSGGYVIGIGRSGGMSSEATKCSNFSSVGKSTTLSLQKDQYLVVSGVVTVKMPVSISALVVYLNSSSASISTSSSTSYNLDANGVYWNVD